MADITHTHFYTVELNGGIDRRAGGVLIGLGDQGADNFRLTVTKGGQLPADMEEATGYFVRPDGTTVIIEGGVSDNIISLTLPAACYDYTGVYTLTIKLKSTAGDFATETTALILDGRILETRSDTVADPDDVWSLSSIWAAIGEKVAEPETEGTAGQALLTDGNGGRYWGSAASGGATGSLIVDGVTYSLRTGTEGAAGYITVELES